MSLFQKHQPVLTKAIGALHARTFYAAFPEHPSPAVYGETADADGQSKFKNQLGKKFEELKQTGATNWGGQEESPYTQEPLNISYPLFSANALVENSKKVFHQWGTENAQDAAGI